MQIHAFINQKAQEFYNRFISFFGSIQENWHTMVIDLVRKMAVLYHFDSMICGWNEDLTNNEDLTATICIELFINSL